MKYQLVQLVIMSLIIFSTVRPDNFTPLPISTDPVITFDYLDSSAVDSAILAIMDDYNIPGVSTCVLRNGELIWSGAYGFANIEENRMVTDSTLFVLASVSKTITATAVMQLWEDGLFGLDDDVNAYLPAELQITNPTYSDDPITIYQFLTHTSSIDHDWEHIHNLYSWGEDSPISLDTFLVNYFMESGEYNHFGPYLNWEPGSQWSYSGPGVALLAYIVQVLTDMAFSEYCQVNIFTPLGMNETAWFLSELDEDHLAMPYYRSGGDYHPYGQYSWPTYPSAMLRTSVMQLAKFLGAYMNMGENDDSQILESSTIEMMTQLQVPNLYPDQGLGWFIVPVTIEGYGTFPFVGHDGDQPGCRTIMSYMLNSDEHIGVIVLTNGESQPGRAAIWHNLATHAIFDGKIYSRNLSLNSSFVEPGVDTLILSTRFNNLNNHPFIASAIVRSIDSTEVISFLLYDDGLHGDDQPDDGLWGGFLIPDTCENMYSVGIRTTNLADDIDFELSDLAQFTTIGPLAVETVEQLHPQNGEIQPNTRVYFNLFLRNRGDLGVAKDISVMIASADSNGEVDPNYMLSAYPDLPPDGFSGGSRYFGIHVSPNAEIGTPINFNVKIFSHNSLFWESSEVLLGYVGLDQSNGVYPADFSLGQNYPNPFNPTTTISYDVPSPSHVLLTIFNITGRTINTLTNSNQAAGYYNIQWNGLDHSGNPVSTGVYFCRLQAGAYSQTIKMVYLR